MPLRGRNLYDRQGNIYFITTTVMNFDRLFSLNENYNLIIIDSLKFLVRRDGVLLFGYIIMPSHIHFVVYFPEGRSLINFMRDFKKFTSVEIRKLAGRENRNELLKRFKENAKVSRGQKYKVWMERFDDLIITTDKQMGVKINYIHDNPVKAGLVSKAEDWKYSSARNYYLNDHSVIYVETDWSLK